VNIKEYILSGVVEAYVLGLASQQERLEFEELSARYPEIIAARIEFEEAIERQAFSDAQQSDPVMKDRILKSIFNVNDYPEEAKLIQMENRPRSNRMMTYVAAASVLLLLATAYFAYNQYSKNKELDTITRNMQQQLDSLNSINEQMANEQRMMSDPNVAVVSLVGTEKAPASSAAIYWDTTSSNVYLVVKNMPRLPSNKQYQLWALIDNQPKDLGLFDSDKNRVMLKMKNVQDADAFAITIENRGNTGGPTLEELQTMGKTL